MEDAETLSDTRVVHPSKLTLLAIWPDGRGRAYPLPDRGHVSIGRSSTCDLQIKDESLSRTHAVLNLNGEITIEDKGSRNGSRFRGSVLPPHRQQRIEVGDTFEFGNILLILQMRPSPPRHSTTAGVSESFIERVARGEISVLVLGETGVGKEVLTRRIHQGSPRAARPLLRLNCAALSESLIESELFGHEKGAFTGASTSKPGLLETAAGGTVFLDEIGELPLSMQSKLLRVVEHQELFRVGAVQSRRIDVRFISATNRDLEREVERGGFRRDLLFRLAGAVLRIPPLRERRSEIVGFAREFLAKAAPNHTPAPQLSPAAMLWLEMHSWPGNLRELRNTIERAVLVCDGPVVEVEHLSSTLGLDVRLDRASDSLDEREQVLDALMRFGGNQSGAARQLGISRNTLMARLDRYGVPRPRKNHSSS